MTQVYNKIELFALCFWSLLSLSLYIKIKVDEPALDIKLYLKATQMDKDNRYRGAF